MTPQTPGLIKLEHVGLTAEGRSILSGINLTINRGDFMAITGPNGGGKTTLLRIMLRLVKPSTGTVSYIPTDKLRIGYLPQKNAIDSHFPITVRDVVEQGLLPVRSITKAERNERVSRVIDELELTHQSGHGLSQLSGGQLQRALLGRALISSPELLVLDEPLSYLDKHFEQRVYEILRKIAHDTTVVLVSHEISTIAAMANRHVIVDRRLHFCHSQSHFVHYDCR